MRLYLDLITEKFDQLDFKQTALDQANLTKTQLQQIYWAFKANKLDHDEIDDMIIELIGTDDDTNDLFDYLNLHGHQTVDCEGKHQDF